MTWHIVLGLIGPHFQQPFEEGSYLVTGSTHKTCFGTQRGVVCTRFQEREGRYAFWEAMRRRVFPGSVSNHHLGILLELLMAALFGEFAVGLRLLDSADRYLPKPAFKYYELVSC